MTGPKISVLMTTCNGSAYISESIRSVLAQSLGDFELILVDDASTDSTIAAIRAVADPRIVLVRNEHNLGVVGSRNRGLAYARGRYVATLDHDDLSLPGRLRLQAEFLDGDPRLAAVSCLARNIGDVSGNRRPTAATGEQLEWLLLVGNPLVYSGLMFRRSIISDRFEFMRPDCLYADDFDFYHRILRVGAIVQVPEVLVEYRYHGRNTFKAKKREMYSNAARVLAATLGAQGFEGDPTATATLLVNHAFGLDPVATTGDLLLVAEALRATRRHFLARHESDSPSGIEAFVDDSLGVIWERLVRASARSGCPTAFRHSALFDRRGRGGLRELLSRTVSVAVGSVRALGGRPALARERR